MLVAGGRAHEIHRSKQYEQREAFTIEVNDPKISPAELCTENALHLFRYLYA